MYFVVKHSVLTNSHSVKIEIIFNEHEIYYAKNRFFVPAFIIKDSQISHSWNIFTSINVVAMDWLQGHWQWFNFQINMHGKMKRPNKMVNRFLMRWFNIVSLKPGKWKSFLLLNHPIVCPSGTYRIPLLLYDDVGGPAIKENDLQ